MPRRPAPATRWATGSPRATASPPGTATPVDRARYAPSPRATWSAKSPRNAELYKALTAELQKERSKK